MKQHDNMFPVEASILSGLAIGGLIQSQFFPSGADVACRLFYRSIHDTYIVKADNHQYYFKIYRYGLRTRNEIQAELELIHHLVDRGISVSQPVRKSDGNYIVEFASMEGRRYGVLFTSVGSMSSDIVDENDAINEKLGYYIASIHNAWDTLECPFDRWNLDLESFIDRPMEHIRAYAQWHSFDVGFLEQVAKKTKQSITAAFTRDKPGFGICHGDFYSGNWRFDDGNNPVLFDFDFCGYGWRAYEISVYLNSFGLGFSAADIEKRNRRRDSFLKGYLKSRALSDGEINNLSLFVPFKRIFNLGTVYISMANTWGDDWVKKNLDGDIEKLKRWVEYLKL